MKDLTQGSISRHIISMATPIFAGMLVQTLYFFVDIYFVRKLGSAAVAGVSAAGNVVLIFGALTQLLGVGTVALMSHAAGRKDHQDASLIFNQSCLIAAILGGLTLVIGYALTDPYLRLVAADEATAMLGREYLFWFLPGMALQFAMIPIGAALIGAGVVKPQMIVQVTTVLLNVVLAPVLIAGWGTGYAMGVAGAGLASSIGVLVGVVLLRVHFSRTQTYVSFHAEQWSPRIAAWTRILTVGLPSCGDLLLFFAYASITYYAISNFGPEAQAGFGIGSRIVAAAFLPAIAIASVVVPVAGQNYGARQTIRVRETLRAASIQSMTIMAAATLICQWKSEALMQLFSPDLEVVQVGAQFLRVVSWNFMLNAVTFVCSGVFQALGYTLPSLLSSALRLVIYALSLIWLASEPDYQLAQVWYLSIAATGLQAALNSALLRRQMRLKLNGT